MFGILKPTLVFIGNLSKTKIKSLKIYFFNKEETNKKENTVLSTLQSVKIIARITRKKHVHPRIT